MTQRCGFCAIMFADVFTLIEWEHADMRAMIYRFLGI